MITVAVCNQKGGVGKTTSTLNLASAATVAGMRVLVVDMDPQCNASQVLGWTRASPGYTVVDALMSDDVQAVDAIHGTSWEGVSVLPAVNALAVLEAPTTPAGALRDVLGRVVDDYDLVLIDCPPSVGHLTLNALTAATLALVVTAPSAFASEGVLLITETIQVVQEHYNPDLRMAGIVCTLMPPRGREATLRLAELRELYAGDLWEPVIPRRAVVEDAIGAGRPLAEFGVDAAPVLAPYATHLAHLMSAARHTPRRRR